MISSKTKNTYDLLCSIVVVVLYCIVVSTYTLIKNRIGDDGVLAILQYKPSVLYLTDRKEKWKFCKKIPTPTQHLQIRPSLVHPFLPQDRLLIQMHLDVPCNAWASC